MSNLTMKVQPHSPLRQVPDYHYQNLTYESGFIFDFWSCGPPAKVKTPKGDKFAGGYPAGFIKRWKQAFSSVMCNPNRILHVCAGAISSAEGYRQDINSDFMPDLECNAEEIAENFPEFVEFFEWVIADPPYNAEAALKYYGVPLLKKSKMLKSMERMCKPGGYIGILDQTTLNWKPKNLKKIAMIAVTSVPNLDVRLFTVYRKDE